MALTLTDCVPLWYLILLTHPYAVVTCRVSPIKALQSVAQTDIANHLIIEPENLVLVFNYLTRSDLINCSLVCKVRFYHSFSSVLIHCVPTSLSGCPNGDNLIEHSDYVATKQRIRNQGCCFTIFWCVNS